MLPVFVIVVLIVMIIVITGIVVICKKVKKFYLNIKFVSKEHQATITGIYNLPGRPGKMSEKELQVEIIHESGNIQYATFRLYSYLFEGDHFKVGNTVNVLVCKQHEKMVVFKYDTPYGKGSSYSIDI